MFRACDFQLHLVLICVFFKYNENHVDCNSAWRLNRLWVYITLIVCIRLILYNVLCGKFVFPTSTVAAAIYFSGNERNAHKFTNYFIHSATTSHNAVDGLEKFGANAQTDLVFMVGLKIRQFRENRSGPIVSNVEAQCCRLIAHKSNDFFIDERFYRRFLLVQCNKRFRIKQSDRMPNTVDICLTVHFILHERPPKKLNVNVLYYSKKNNRSVLTNRHVLYVYGTLNFNRYQSIWFSLKRSNLLQTDLIIFPFVYTKRHYPSVTG